MKNLLAIALLFFTSLAMAQDKIYRTNDQVIECKIVEVGSKVITFKQNDEADAAIISIDRVDVVKIVFEDGTVMEITPAEKDEELYTKDRKQAWKFDFLSPLFNHTTIGYERSIEPGISQEAYIGIIGLGQDNYSSGDFKARYRGLYAKYGVKFIKPRSGLFETRTRFEHLLDGSYIKPEVNFGAFSFNRRYSVITNPNSWPYNVEEGVSKTTNIYGGIQIVGGMQRVYNNRFLMDYYFGIGYGFINRSTDLPEGAVVNEFSSRSTFGVLSGESDFPLTFSAGIRIGILTD